MQKISRVVDLNKAGFDAAYWANKSPVERLEALEKLRSQQVKVNGVRQKFQRVYKLVNQA